MSIERAAGTTSLMDVLDRVLDKGIVIDAWVSAEVPIADVRVVVASIATYLSYSKSTGRPGELPTSGEFGNVMSSRSALRSDEDDDDDDDDGSGGSSGAPAMLEAPRWPRRPPPRRPERTRRKT
jgi:gas vesicle structural protein